MKRLICSAAVASALLAVTAVPSGAVHLPLTPLALSAFDTLVIRSAHGRTFVLHGCEFNIGHLLYGNAGQHTTPFDVIMHYSRHM